MNWNTDTDIYRDCLGIDSAGPRPTHYELLGLRPYRVAPTQVTESSNRRLQQLESLRAGHRMNMHTRLVSEIEMARDCLADPIRKRVYDRRIQRELLVHSSTSVATRASVAEAFRRSSHKPALAVEESNDSAHKPALTADSTAAGRRQLFLDAFADCRQRRQGLRTAFARRSDSRMERTESHINPKPAMSRTSLLMAAKLSGVLLILAYSLYASLAVTDRKTAAVSGVAGGANTAIRALSEVSQSASNENSDAMATPAEVNSSPGTDRLGIEAEASLSIPVVADQSTASLAPESPQKVLPVKDVSVTVTLASQPAGARAIVDGVDVGTTPLTTELAPGEHELYMQSPTHHPHRRRISASVDNCSFEFKLIPVIHEQNRGPSSSPNSESADAQLKRLDQQALLAELPPKVDVVGNDLSEWQKKEVVHTLTRLLNTQWKERDPQILKRVYRQLTDISHDPRIPFSVGLMMENQGDFPRALHWYKKARESGTVIPHFEAWRRSINIRMRLKETDLALDECIDLIDVLVGLAQAKYDRFEEIERVLAYNVRFVGFIFGYVTRLSEYDARVFVANVQSEENNVLARLHQFPSSEDYLAIFESGKNDVRRTADELRTLEDETNRLNRIEAEMNNQKINQGEVEIRKTYGPHVPAPDGIDYYEDRGSVGWHYYGPYYYRWFWPPIGRSRITKETKAISEWRRVIKPTYRHAPRASQYIQTYFASNLELVRRNLLETFPDEHAVIQRVFVTK